LSRALKQKKKTMLERCSAVQRILKSKKTIPELMVLQNER